MIHNYRESLITNLPPDAGSDLARALARLYALVPSLSLPGPSDVSVADLPPAESSTHALHLAPEGAILAHVDNLDASGQTIVGASLGATRILRLERQGDESQGWDVLLPSGSVYVQKYVELTRLSSPVKLTTGDACGTSINTLSSRSGRRAIGEACRCRRDIALASWFA